MSAHFCLVVLNLFEVSHFLIKCCIFFTYRVLVILIFKKHCIVSYLVQIVLNPKALHEQFKNHIRCKTQGNNHLFGLSNIMQKRILYGICHQRSSIPACTILNSGKELRCPLSCHKRFNGLVD